MGGVIVLRKGLIQSQNENQWTAPCAIGTGGLSVGFQAGAAKVDHIIVLTQKDQVDMFPSNGQLQIKGSANATAANMDEMSVPLWEWEVIPMIRINIQLLDSIHIPLGIKGFTLVSLWKER